MKAKPRTFAIMLFLAAIAANMAYAQASNPQASSLNGASCNNFILSTPVIASSVSENCAWSGGTLNIYAGSGNSGWASVSITGLNGKSYFSKVATSWNISYIGNAYMPAQVYTIKLTTGRGGGSYGNAAVELATSSISANSSSPSQTSVAPTTTISQTSGAPTTTITVRPQPQPQHGNATLPAAASSSSSSQNGGTFLGIVVVALLILYYFSRVYLAHKRAVKKKIEKWNAGLNTSINSGSPGLGLSRNPHATGQPNVMGGNVIGSNAVYGNMHNPSVYGQRRVVNYTGNFYDTEDGM